ncbi:MAG: hypothetical protein ACI8W1_001168 [Candidatus Azotimanducaceae bacterium]|jgi:hypothetical protein
MNISFFIVQRILRQNYQERHGYANPLKARHGNRIMAAHAPVAKYSAFN